MRKSVRLAAFVAVVVAVLVPTAAFASTVTIPSTNPFKVPSDSLGHPTPFTIAATGFTAGSQVFVEQCDGTPPTTAGWDPTINCDAGSAPAPAIADAGGKAIFPAGDPTRHRACRRRHERSRRNRDGPDVHLRRVGAACRRRVVTNHAPATTTTTATTSPTISPVCDDDDEELLDAWPDGSVIARKVWSGVTATLLDETRTLQFVNVCSVFFGADAPGATQLKTC